MQVSPSFLVPIAPLRLQNKVQHMKRATESERLLYHEDDVWLGGCAFGAHQKNIIKLKIFETCKDSFLLTKSC